MDPLSNASGSFLNAQNIRWRIFNLSKQIDLLTFVPHNLHNCANIYQIFSITEITIKTTLSARLHLITLNVGLHATYE